MKQEINMFYTISYYMYIIINGTTKNTREQNVVCLSTLYCNKRVTNKFRLFQNM